MVRTTIFSVILGCIIVNVSFSQDSDCKVLLDGLNEKYDGQCKKGLAHGEGTAIGALGKYVGNFKKGFPNGKGKLSYERSNVASSYYEGNWQRGKRDGEGTYYFSKDSITTGFWEDDNYIGKYSFPYKVLSSQAIPKNKFIKNENSDIPGIEIQFKRQGAHTMADIVNIDVQISSGSKLRQQNYVLIENVEFPFEAHLTMTVKNSSKSVTLGITNTSLANFSFVINEKADWIVIVDY